ncbi:MAG: DUF1273 domain-containing protein [Oscillospiraceae bacterium]|nr:DUF1273 domain-containing protein [Oscillospiraceae bacterium]
MICGFSGHRPHRLPWGGDEDSPGCRALKARMAQALSQLHREGADVFLCGMARGCDLYFAEAVLDLRRSAPEVELWAVLPCPSQADRWPAAERRRYRLLCRACRQVVMLQEAYTPGCMLRRNAWILDHADCLLTVYDGGSGGTAWTVREAARRGLTVVPLWR